MLYESEKNPRLLGWYWVSSETIFRVAAEFKSQRYVLKSMNFYSHEEKLYGNEAFVLHHLIVSNPSG